MEKEEEQEDVEEHKEGNERHERSQGKVSNKGQDRGGWWGGARPQKRRKMKGKNIKQEGKQTRRCERT